MTFFNDANFMQNNEVQKNEYGNWIGKSGINWLPFPNLSQSLTCPVNKLCLMVKYAFLTQFDAIFNYALLQVISLKITLIQGHFNKKWAVPRGLITSISMGIVWDIYGVISQYH